MKVVIHAGISPFDSQLLKKILKANCKQLQSEGLTWGVCKIPKSQNISFNQARINYNWIERFTKKATADVGHDGVALIFLDSPKAMQARIALKEIDVLISRRLGSATLWTLALEHPFRYFNQIYEHNILDPAISTPFPTSYAEAARIACKKGFINTFTRNRMDTHVFDYARFTRRLSAAIGKKVMVFKSRYATSIPVDGSHAFINWILGRVTPLQKEVNRNSEYKQTNPTMARPSRLLIHRVVMRKTLRDTGQSYRFHDKGVSWNELVNVIAEQQLWSHYQDMRYAKKLFQNTYEDWSSICDSCSFLQSTGATQSN